MIETYVDKSLSFVTAHKEYLMYIDNMYTKIYHDDIQPEMVDNSDISKYWERPPRMKIKQDDTSVQIVNLITPDDKLWRPIAGTITNSDIRVLEDYFSIRFPNSYREYLSYMHYYQIFWNQDIRLYPKPINTWSEILKKKNEDKRAFTLDRQLFSIGEYSDYGDICFDMNDKESENNDYPIVFVDYETGDYSDVIADNFIGLLTFALNSKDPELKELNPSEKKQFGNL